MLKLENNILYLIKGDTAALNINLGNYKYQIGDTLTLTVKKDFSIFAYISKTVPANEEIILSSTDSANMQIGSYWYDVQLTKVNGEIETVMGPNRLELVEDVTTENDLIINDPTAKYVKSINNKYGEVTLTATDIGAVEASDLAQVAFSGDYEDLTNKPSFPEPYELPEASTTELGGVKVDGNTIIINDGVISSVGGTGDVIGDDLKKLTNLSWLYTGFLTDAINALECNTLNDVIKGLREGLMITKAGTSGSVTIPSDTWLSYYQRFYRPNGGVFGDATSFGDIELLPNIYIVPIGTNLLIGAKEDISLALRNNLRYDNSSSHLNATTLKGAIDEIAANEMNHVTNEELERVLSDKNYVDESALEESLNNKQNILISGTTIKTINGNSLLGSGNLILEGGEGGSANWGNIGGNIAEQEDLSEALNAKQDKLSSGTNIKTINGNSLLGEGNLIIGGGTGSSEWGGIGGTITNQTDLIAELNKKTDNSDLAAVAISGNYYDLTNRPVIPTQYVLPTASTTTLGGIKIGTGLTIVNGVVSATAAAYSAGNGIKIENNIISLDLANADSEAY